MSFLRYLRYNGDNCSHPLVTTNELSEYQNRVTFMRDDFAHLLRMPHAKFWCQVIYDNSLQTSINSYLQNAPRDVIDDDLVDLHRKVFMVCLRMSTHKESKKDFFTPSVFGELLYNRFVFDMPRLYDFVRLYYTGNAVLVSKAVKNVFLQQPAYHDDLALSALQISEVCGYSLIKVIITQKCLEKSYKQLESLVGVTSLFMELPDHKTMSAIFEIIEFVVDVCENLLVWFKCFDNVSAFATDQFVTILSEIYISIFRVHQSLISIDPSVIMNAGLDIQRTKTISHRPLKLLVATFQSLLDTILKLEEISECAEKYLELLTSVLCQAKFIRHYEICKPFDDIISIFKELNYHIDDTRLALIENALFEACVIEKVEKPIKSKKVPPMNVNNSKTTNVAAIKDPVIDSICKLSEVEISSMIQSVKDILPNLGSGFIYKCLEHYDFTLESVIDMLLTENLPNELVAIDRNLKRSTDEKQFRLIDERRNVFDYDEFDVFHGRKIDRSRVHQGKRQDTIAFRDAETVERLKPLYDAYGNESLAEGASIYDKPSGVDLYDDDYDSEDEQNASTPLSPGLTEQQVDNDERMNKRKIYTMQDSQEQSEPARDTRKDFCSNPAEIREKREAAWINGHPKKHYDVKGAEKGQGQSKEILKNRAFKEKNKSSNRRSQADWKRRVP